MSHYQTVLTWIVAIITVGFVLVRPFRLSEAVWAVVGAVLLVLMGILSLRQALTAAGKGLDVYLFLTGMMLISELARREGVFDWLAGHAVAASKSSPRRLFALVYFVGIGVTVLLSNDATAVVLTPAVQSAVKAAQAEPLPYLLICAFIANAASFVLPISNPANLVVFGRDMPPLERWLFTFTLPSLVSIGATYVLLRVLARKLLAGRITAPPRHVALSRSGIIALAGVGFLAVVLIVASGMGQPLGAPACVAAFLVLAVIMSRDRRAPREALLKIPWSILPLVAGLFVLVEGMNRAGALPAAVHVLNRVRESPPVAAALTSAFAVALISNIMNNLPSGLIAGTAVHAAHIQGIVGAAVLIGIDLGPNLSVTGSLATILWLIAIRREGQGIGFLQFLKWGAVIMPPTLALAVLALLMKIW
ncbi:MAG TPA: arsenic transporter [Bryobacteraceae bacterium]|jgi:arsenical pump membrane protein|nr:arsenic transporter [Bryobacteraceae bacterium]